MVQRRSSWTRLWYVHKTKPLVTETQPATQTEINRWTQTLLEKNRKKEKRYRTHAVQLKCCVLLFAVRRGGNNTNASVWTRTAPPAVPFSFAPRSHVSPLPHSGGPSHGLPPWWPAPLARGEEHWERVTGLPRVTHIRHILARWAVTITSWWYLVLLTWLTWFSIYLSII